MAGLPRAVFLSYASQDAQAARRVCEALRAAGIEVWFDQSELRGGDSWDAAIRKQIRECALFVPIISAATEARSEGYFRLEWKLAGDRSDLIASAKAFLLPVAIDGVREADALVPDKFREVQWMRLGQGPIPATFVERVARLLSPDREAASSGPTPRAANAGPTPTRRRRAFGLAAAAAAAVVVAAALFAYQASHRGGAIASVAVLPFENGTGDPAIGYLSDGISESLINRLAGVNGLNVISRTSAFAFRDRKLEPIEIGRKLGVDALVLGSVAQRGSSLAISAELVLVRDATQLWGEKYARQADDVMKVEGEIASTIARNLRRQLSGEEKAKLARAATSDPEAYRLYLKGRDFLVGNQRQMDKSVDYLQQAVARAPDYAMAHAGLAEAYTRQAFLRGEDREQAVAKARVAVNRALELDPDLAEAHTALALVRFFFEWDWAGAEAEFDRALALNPGSLLVNEEFGGFLTMVGRLDEGLAKSRVAAALDPLSVGPVHDMAVNAMIRHDYDAAAAGFRRAIDIDPNWTWGYIKLARTLAMRKSCDEALAQAAIAEGKIAGAAAPLSQSWLGVTYATCGDAARARQKLDALHSLAKSRYVDPVTYAAIYSALGELDEALRWYEKAFEDRTPNMVFAAIAPRLSPELAGNARFDAIVARMRFPQATR